jgi:hypothetical protein
MYGLIKIGQPHERDADTDDVSLCDIGTDGFFITYGSREDIEKIAHYLTEKKHPWEYRAVPLPWQPEQPS